MINRCINICLMLALVGTLSACAGGDTPGTTIDIQGADTVGGDTPASPDAVAPDTTTEPTPQEEKVRDPRADAYEELLGGCQPLTLLTAHSRKSEKGHDARVVHGAHSCLP